MATQQEKPSLLGFATQKALKEVSVPAASKWVDQQGLKEQPAPPTVSSVATPEEAVVAVVEELKL